MGFYVIMLSCFSWVLCPEGVQHIRGNLENCLKGCSMFQQRTITCTSLTFLYNLLTGTLLLLSELPSSGTFLARPLEPRFFLLPCRPRRPGIQAATGLPLPARLGRLPSWNPQLSRRSSSCTCALGGRLCTSDSWLHRSRSRTLHGSRTYVRDTVVKRSHPLQNDDTCILRPYTHSERRE